MKRLVMLAAACCLSHAALAGPIGYAVQSNGNDHLYSIDLATGVSTDLGALNFGDAEGISFGADGELYTIGGSVNEFWKITTPPGTLIGATGTRNGVDAGLGLDPTTSVMYNLNGGTTTGLYTVNTATGATALIGTSSSFGDNIAIDSTGTAYAIDAIFADSLFTVNLSNGALTAVGGLGLGDVSMQVGSSFDSAGVLWMLDSNGGIHTVNTSTGAATFVASTIGVTGAPLANWEGLAIQVDGSPVVPEPGTMALLGCGLLALRRRRR